MNNFGVVQVFKPAQDVINNRLYLVLIKEFARLQQLLKIHIRQSQNQIGVIEILCVVLAARTML